nr:MAG TPA: Lethal (2) giant discs 1, ENDOCYTOSIS, PROTEIN BINDING [Caudoviricetes sp.]
MDTAIVGLVCSIATLVIKALVDLCVERYRAAKAERDAREDIEDDLRARVFLWKEHAYAVRIAAISAGVDVGNLPPLPKEG